MLLRRETLARIRDGRITLAFRRWRRPTVRAGGTLLTAVGQLAIHAIDPVAIETIGDDEAVAAGFPDARALRRELDRRREGDVYRVRLSWIGDDPRAALRQKTPEGDERALLVRRLARMDTRSPSGPWTRRYLSAIGAAPGVRAADLARAAGQPTPEFKTRARRLKALGLTESLEVGYRLSPRGRAALSALDD